MATDFGIPTTAPTGAIVARGEPNDVISMKIETAANCAPGRHVKRGTTAVDLVVGDASTAPIGILGYEQTEAGQDKPATVDTAFGASDYAPVMRGGSYIYNGYLTKGCSVAPGDLLANWTTGALIGPVEPAGTGLWVKIPFSKNASEVTTSITPEAGMMVLDARIQTTTAVASGTITVGTLSSGTGDADGFLVADATSTAYHLGPRNDVDATAASITLGELLTEVEIKDATGTPVFYAVPTPYKCDGADAFSYTTSAHASIGNIMLNLYTPHFRIIAEAANTKDATSAAGDVLVWNLLG